MVIIYSATKGLAAMTMALAHSRGWLDFEAQVASYWPEFAQQGKHAITVRQLLAHQAGLFALDEPVDAPVGRRSRSPGRGAGAADTGVAGRARAGVSRHHAGLLSKASCCAASIRGIARSESSSRTRSRRRSGWMSTSGCRRRFRMRGWRRTRAAGPDADGDGIRAANVARHVQSTLEHQPRAGGIRRCRSTSHSIYVRNLEVPSGGGVGTARAMARAYSAFASGGELGLWSETLRLLAAPAVPRATVSTMNA